jgi:hypothetical protein
MTSFTHPVPGPVKLDAGHSGGEQPFVGLARGHWPAVGQRAVPEAGLPRRGIVVAQPGILRHPEVDELRQLVEHDRDRVAAREELAA